MIIFKNYLSIYTKKNIRLINLLKKYYPRLWIDAELVCFESSKLAFFCFNSSMYLEKLFLCNLKIRQNKVTFPFMFPNTKYICIYNPCISKYQTADFMNSLLLKVNGFNFTKLKRIINAVSISAENLISILVNLVL